MIDLHTHSIFSFDADYTLNEMLKGAERAGISELCITDHVDFDAPNIEDRLPNLTARRESAENADNYSVHLTLGAEISLQDSASAKATWEYICDAELDFIIASVHIIDGKEVWTEEFYRGRTKEQTYTEYLEAVLRMLPTFPEMDILGHYDFVAKYAPYPDRSFDYELAPAIFDDVLAFLLDYHKSLEINTSIWRGDRAWGLDLLKRFVALGGRYITIGSDAHNPWAIGYRVKEAMVMAKEAGVRSIAVFSQRRPYFIDL